MNEEFNYVLFWHGDIGESKRIQTTIWDFWITGSPAPSSISRMTSQLYNGKIYCPAYGGTDIQYTISPLIHGLSERKLQSNCGLGRLNFMKEKFTVLKITD